MAVSKREKRAKQKAQPKGKGLLSVEDPNQYYAKTPAWMFENSDKDMWTFTKEHIGDAIWSEILPTLQSFETQTWSEILVKNKKNNHTLNMENLNKVAQDRLISMYVEAESIISLRLTARHRLYGYMIGNVFNVLWYDDNHGDNDTCVCRSHLKHT